MKTLQDFSPYNELYWAPNGSRSKRQTVSVQTANCSNGFKQLQTINKGLIKLNDRSFKKKKQSLCFMS